MPDGFESPFDDVPSPPPLPPDDRLWRHPSEVGGAALLGPPPPTRARLGSALATGAGVAFVVIGALTVATWMDARSTTTTRQSQPIETHVMLVASTTSTSITTTAPRHPGWLGVSAANVPAGVQVTECEAGSPAATALRTGDVIVQFDASPVTKLSDLVGLLERSKPGSLAHIRIERQGVDQTVTVTLASR